MRGQDGRFGVWWANFSGGGEGARAPAAHAGGAKGGEGRRETAEEVFLPRAAPCLHVTLLSPRPMGPCALQWMCKVTLPTGAGAARR